MTAAARMARPALGVALFALFMLPWPGLGAAYCRLVGAWARAVLDPSFPPVTLRYAPASETSPPGGPWELRVRADDATTGRFVGTALDLRRSGYIQGAMFAALTLVTKLKWRRRCGVLLAGLAALQMLPLLPVLSFFSGKLPVRAFRFSSPVQAGVDVAYHALVTPPGMAFALPATLWLFLVWWLDPAAIHWFTSRATGTR